MSDFDIARDLPWILQLAKALSSAGGFLPAHIRSEGELVAVIVAGRELGIPAMASVRGVRLIQGQVTLDASLQLGLMIRAGCKVKWVDDGRGGQAVLELTRPGQDTHTSRYGMDDATRAGLVKAGGNWAKHPAAMLRARAVSAAGKAYCSDVLAGVYLPDELDDVAAADVPAPAPPVPALPAAPARSPDEVLQDLANLLEDLRATRNLADLTVCREAANDMKAHLTTAQKRTVSEAIKEATARTEGKAAT